MVTVSGSPAERMLNTGQAAQYLGVGRATLEKARVQGKGPRFYKMAGSVRYDRGDLDAWIRGCAVETVDSRQQAVRSGKAAA